ncbi:MAG TPA: GNAT family N-acetyltransferase [Actinomycetota bacterium]|nr:GNAT family N-acetyltransferase [Actinomycetota bacterium]
MDGPPPDDVRLRDATHDDLPIFYEHQRDPVASRMAAFASRDLDAFMEHWTSRILENETGVAKTVLVGGRVAGNILAFDHDGRREIGYWIGREFWGRGVATRALAAFLVEVTERPLYAGVATHNVASIRVLEKSGFVVVDEPVEPPEDGVEELLFRLDA